MLFERSLLTLLLTKKGSFAKKFVPFGLLGCFYTVDLRTKWNKTQGISIMSSTKKRIMLTFFFSVFPFDSPENIRKTKGFLKVFLMFSGGSKGNIGKKRFKVETLSHLRCSVGEGVFKSFTKFAGKHLCQSFLLKKRLAQVFSCEFCEIFKNTFFYRTPQVAVSAQVVFGKCWEWKLIFFEYLPTHKNYAKVIQFSKFLFQMLCCG